MSAVVDMVSGVTRLTVRRWQKHGHDRLYVETDNGIKVGWFDLRTQRHHLDQPGMWPEFQQAIADWRALPKATVPQKSRRGRQPVDLAGREAGAVLRDRAQRLQPKHGALRFAARLLNIKTADYAWRTGAVGEQQVGSKLDPLVKRGWKLLHGIDFGMGGDIDHLVIGPHGVFTVNTKHHPRAKVVVGDKVLFIRGHQQPYIGKACREAQRVRIALSEAISRQVHVGPLIVVHGHRSLSGWMAKRPQGVQVLPSWAVAWWCRMPGQPVLSGADVEEIYAAARSSATWASV